MNADNNPQTILVIDDDDNNLDVIMDYFKDRPYRILFAHNGQRGYEVAAAEIPDLIISDWAMPLMNGIDLTLKLKATRATKDIPVVIATGVMTSAEDLKEALEAGAIDYIRKPYNPLELTARVNAALVLSTTIQASLRQNEEIQRLMQERLDLKERELSVQALQSKERMQFLSEMQADLDTLGEEADLRKHDTFVRLRRKLSRALQEDRSDDSFMLHFEAVHTDFFNKVKERTDNLTANDLRLIAYIKLGMNNKEVAQMAGVEVGTVKTNLNRLKKKLQLASEDSLRQYVLNL
ncbi:MAG: response regulator [Bacteroidota bacterium]